MQSKLSRRVISKAVAAKILAEPARQKHWIKVLAAYLLEQNLVEDADLLINDVARELFLQSGHLFVDVASAHPLSETVRRELKHMLAEVTNAKRVELAEHTDKTLLGGLRARTPDGQFDASVQSKLKQLASIT